MQVKFNLKDQRESPTFIFAILRYSGYRFKYSTQREVPPNHWNPKTQRVYKTKHYPAHFEVNALLDSFASKIIAVLSKFQSEGHTPTPSELKVELDRFYGRTNARDEKSFFGYFAKYIEDKRTDPDKPIAQGTVKIFKRVLRYLEEYKPKADFPQIDMKFFKGYLRFLYEVKKLGKNTVNYHVKKLNQVLKAADLEGVNRNRAYREFVPPSATTFGIYYNESELSQLLDFNFSNKKHLERVRDHFVLASYIGARYGDYLSLDKRNIHNLQDLNGTSYKTITYALSKSDKRLVVSAPLHPLAEKVLKKYNGRFPPKISNQKMNKYLKEMAKLAGFTQLVTIPSQKKGEAPREVEKWELTKTHTARRNLISNAKNAGIPDSDIMLLTGHRSQSSFKLYDKTSPEENAARISQSSFFKPTKLKIAK